ncbi:MAG TPA: DNA polymerase IV [bacterium]|nr:DNA polymerase IV [bacterium]
MPARDRLIVHVDMDAFYASIEVRDNPHYRGLPVVVGGAPGGRGVVAAASYEARRYGIKSAMPSREAFARCPQALFLSMDMAKYRGVSDQLFELLDTFTPRVERVSIDEAFLDLTGCPALGGEEADPTGAPLAVARTIKTRIGEALRLPLSVGAAPNKFLAKLAAELAKPDGARAIRMEEAEAVLAPLPVIVLWGVGAQTRQRLGAIGIHTVGDLQRTPTSVLRASLGMVAEHLARLSRGIDDRQVEVSRETKSVGRETTFEEDTVNRERLDRTLGMLAEDVGRALRGEGLGGRTVTLKVRYDNFQTLTRNLTLPSPTQSGAVVHRAALGLLDRLGPLPRAVRLIGVTVSALSRADLAQVSLFDEDGHHAQIDEVVDAINERFGEGTVRQARAFDAEDDPPAG